MSKRIKLKKVDTRKLREGLGLNQSEFWGRIEVTEVRFAFRLPTGSAYAASFCWLSRHRSMNRSGEMCPSVE